MVIAVTNLKGGVGKTTIATNLAAALAHRDYDVCIVDTDLGQQSSMEWSGNRSEDLKPITVVGVAQKQLTKEVSKFRKRFDVIIIDGSPQLSELADRTILASDLVLIPLTPSLYDYRGFENFLDRFEKINGVKEAAGGSTRAYVLLNRVNPRTRASKDIVEGVKEYEMSILDTAIVNRIAYADSAAEGKGVVEYSDRKAREEFSRLTEELVQLIA